VKRLILAGNPNVGKSALFARLTGLDIIASNYPGTTVAYSRGTTVIGGRRITVIDTPGVYCLDPVCAADQVTADILRSLDPGDVVLNVMDATNLERSLTLTLQLLALGAPVVIALNKWDLAQPRGITIDTAALSEELGVPVVPVVGVSGAGIRELVATLARVPEKPRPPTRTFPESKEARWELIGRITARVQRLSHRHPTFAEGLQELTIRMPWAACIAIVVAALSFWVIRTSAEWFIGSVADPLFMNGFLPFITRLFAGMPDGHRLRLLLLGSSGSPMESFGVLTTGLYVPLVAVLPYIVAFNLVLAVLEDSGYLVRLAVVLDRYFHVLGLHGYAAVPFILGMGCKVPGVLATRILETEREKMIAMSLILLMTPCMPQSAMILSVVGKHGWQATAVVFGTLALTGLGAALLLNRLLKGGAPELFVEIPPYLAPSPRSLLKKTVMRVRSFLTEAVPMIIAGIAAVSVLELAGGIRLLTRVFGPPLTAILGLPPELAVVMVSGFLRKDVSIALLSPFNLGAGQAVVAAVVLVVYLPCVATFTTMARELRLRTVIAVLALGLAAATAAGVAVRVLLSAAG